MVRVYVDKEIRIRHIIKKRQDDVDDTIDLLCESLGVVGSRDVNKISVKIFKELLGALRNEENVSSDELAEKTGLTRGAVVHHLNRMLKAGIVIRTKRGYEIRTYDLESLVDAVKNDVLRIFDDLRGVAAELDNALKLKPQQRE